MVRNPNYREPSKEDIERALERCGYEYYLPLKLLDELIILSSYHLLDYPIESAFDSVLLNSEEEFDVNRLEFYRSLNFDSYSGNNPLEKAIFTLKSLSQDIDFRGYESGKHDFQRKVENFKRELDEVDRVFFKEMDNGIDDESVSLVVSLGALLEESIRVGVKAKGYTHEVKKIDRYSDYIRSSKASMVRPDFLVKLMKKSIRAPKKVEVKSGHKIIIYLEDVTNSMTQNKGYIIANTIKKLMLKDKRVVHYYQFAGDHIVFQKLENYDEKFKAFTEPISYYDRKNDYPVLIRYINSIYKNGDVILATDGNDYVGLMETNLVYHYLGTIHNQDMKNFVKRTGGKYLLL